MEAILFGVAGGFVGAAPGLWLCRRARKGAHPSMGAGLGAILGSFCLLTVCIGGAYRGLGSAWFACAMSALSFYLALWCVEALLVGRWMNRTQREVSLHGGVRTTTR